MSTDCGQKRAKEVGETAQVKALAALNEVMPSTELDDGIDRAQAFLLYMQFRGDLLMTAKAMNISPLNMAVCAQQEQWEARWNSIATMKNSESPASVERGVNRALNFVQAHRLRISVEKAVRMLHDMSPAEIRDMCYTVVTKTDKNGVETEERKLNTRPFADLASALEKIHVMTYLALNDTAKERTDRTHKDQTEGVSNVEIHAAIAKAMSEVSNTVTPQGLILDCKLEQEEEGGGAG
jgi:hypothetical protein